MGLYDKMNLSVARVARMANRLGFSFANKTLNDTAAEAALYRGAVLKCTTCRCGPECDALLDSGEALETAPAYCRNKDLFRTA